MTQPQIDLTDGPAQPAPVVGTIPAKQPRRARTKAPPAPPPQPLTSEQQKAAHGQLVHAFGLLAQMLGKIAAAYRGEHWLIPEKEAAELGEACAGAVEPYMTEAAKWVPAAMAVIVVTGSVVPRLEMDRKLLAQKEADKQAKQLPPAEQAKPEDTKDA
jgi:hypothetical protein